MNASTIERTGGEVHGRVNGTPEKGIRMTTTHTRDTRYDDGVSELTPDEWERKELATRLGRPFQDPTKLPAPAPNGTGRMVTCVEFPGRAYTVTEAAQLAGRKTNSIFGATEKGYASNGLHFKWLPGHEPSRHPRRKSPRKAARLVTCDERPGMEYTLDQAAELAGTTRSGVYGCVYRGTACQGFTFRWKPDDAAAVKSPPPTPLPPAVARRKYRKRGKGRGKAAKPAIVSVAPPPPQRQQRPAPAPAAMLDADACARLAVALGRAGPVDQQSAAALFRWAEAVAADWGRLAAVLDGRADVGFDGGRVTVRERSRHA